MSSTDIWRFLISGPLDLGKRRKLKWSQPSLSRADSVIDLDYLVIRSPMPIGRIYSLNSRFVLEKPDFTARRPRISDIVEASSTKLPLKLPLMTVVDT